MTIRELKRKAAARLNEAGIETGAFEAAVLLQTLLNCGAGDLLLRQGETASSNLIQSVFDCVDRRIGGEPLQYMIGAWDFFNDTFFVGPGVLIPRPATEEFCAYSLERLRDYTSPVVFDLCAGSGCIGLSVKRARPDAQVFLLERSEEAMAYLLKNRDHLGLREEISVIKGDVLQGFEAFDFLPRPNVILSNPPYIETSLLPSLQCEVQKEPSMALDGGEDGLTFYRCFASRWLPFLEPGGLFGIECGEDQAESIAKMIEPFCLNIELLPDFNGVQRFVFARKRG